MKSETRLVFDTNVLVSALLVEDSVPDIALHKAESIGALLYSSYTFAELIVALRKPKLQPYLLPGRIEALLARIHMNWEEVEIIHRVRASRDPKDDMFLDLALSGQACTLITGDRDLLSLSPYRGLEIIPPSVFLSRHADA